VGPSLLVENSGARKIDFRALFLLTSVNTVSTSLEVASNTKATQRWPVILRILATPEGALATSEFITYDSLGDGI